MRSELLRVFVCGLMLVLVSGGCGSGKEKSEPDAGGADTAKQVTDAESETDTMPSTESNCANGVDDDGDGDADCRDDDCAGKSCRMGMKATCVGTKCQGGEAGVECGDGVDNDHDLSPDCKDADCKGTCICRDDCKETCGNDKDDDLDGVVDNGCPCEYQGKTKGLCKKGVISPKGECEAPAGYQSNERICDGQDNDCDGGTDEGCKCPFKGLKTGVCAATFRVEDGSCGSPTSYEMKEDNCDGRDNDCDGLIDEDCSSCEYGGSKKGVCQFGLIDESSGDCLPPSSFQSDETLCDSLDNDCNGVADEGCRCDYDGQIAGVCGNARRKSDGTCEKPSAYVGDEMAPKNCDGLDNDCDGVIDENCTSCPYKGKAVGVCSYGSSKGGSCEKPAPYEVNESKCDRRDNDCDGIADEGCACRGNGTNLGVCSKSIFNPSTGRCQLPPFHEKTESSCGDGLDNDCDGDRDCFDSDCTMAACGQNDQGKCAAKGPNCIGGEVDCGNQKDDDNDGLVDCRDTDCARKNCGEQRGNRGVCRVGNCAGGESSCGDSKDNDADGATDCDDGDCVGQGNCPDKEVDCTNGRSEDSDDLIDCDDPDCASKNNCGHIVFLTSGKYEGDLSTRNGIEDFYTPDPIPTLDAICQKHADQAGRAGHWNAVLSDGAMLPAYNGGTGGHIDTFGPIFNGRQPSKLVDNTMNGALFWGGKALLAGLAYDEQGNALSTASTKPVSVWTGAKSNGKVAATHCKKWTTDYYQTKGMAGLVDDAPSMSVAGKHIEDAAARCDRDRHLMCMGGQIEEDCNSVADDDRDGAANCEDPDCRFEPKCSQMMFATSTRYTGDLGPISNADAECQKRAVAGLGMQKAQKWGKWRAVLGVTAPPNVKNRLTFDKSKRVISVNGDTFFRPGHEIFESNGTLQPINVDEFGKTIYQNFYVWSALRHNGNSYTGFVRGNCGDWSTTKSTSDGRAGRLDKPANDNWIDWSTRSCNNKHRIYCIGGQ